MAHSSGILGQTIGTGDKIQDNNPDTLRPDCAKPVSDRRPAGRFRRKWREIRYRALSTPAKLG
jgi:hypothetical protein